MSIFARPPALYPFGAYNAISPMAANGVPYAATLGKDISVISWTQSLLAVAPNDGANFWTISFFIVPNPPGAAFSIASFNTISFPATAWGSIVIDRAVFTVPDISKNAFMALQISATKTGAPGVLFIPGPLLQVF